MSELNKYREIIRYYDNASLDPDNNDPATQRHIILTRRLVQLDLMLAWAELKNRQTTQLKEMYLREMKSALTELVDVVETLLENNLINEGHYLRMNNSLKVKYEMTEELEKTGNALCIMTYYDLRE